MRFASEIYQWVENKSCHKEKDGAGGEREICHYSYAKEWSSSPVNSDSFHCVQTSSCRDTYTGEIIRNDGSIPTMLQQTYTAPANEVALGSTFGVNKGMLSQLGGSRPAKISNSVAWVPGVVDGRNYASPYGTYVKFQASKYGDTVGDVRTYITRDSLKEQVTPISAIAKQVQSSFKTGEASLVNWDTGKSGTFRNVNWAVTGSFSKSDFLDEKTNENNTTTWLLRFVGWLLMFLGLQLVTGPISLVPEVVPCIGGLLGEVVGCALCCLNFGISLSISLFVIGLAWLMARPLYGLLLFAAAAAIVGAAICARSRLGKPARVPIVSPLAQAEQGMHGIQQQRMPFVQAMPQPQQMQVTVPAGVLPGQTIQVALPDGSSRNVVVPPGVQAGQTMLVTV